MWLAHFAYKHRESVFCVQISPGMETSLAGWKYWQEALPWKTHCVQYLYTTGVA